MAIVKAGRGPFNIDDLGIYENGETSFSPTNIRVTFDIDDYVDFGGSYAPGGPAGFTGTVTSITETDAGSTKFTVTGANADAPTLFGLIDSGNFAAATAYVLRQDDQIFGRGRDDRLFGYAGDDRIYGAAGADTLVGGVGADRLRGDAGADTFSFLALGDSTVAGTGRDRILDFSAREGDKIDLSAIDAITGGGDEAFTVVTDRFHRVAGELLVTATDGGFLVRGDVDGDRVADFALVVDTTGPLGANDFTL